jgi:predicted ATPase
VTILVTSRARLNVLGEHAYPVRALPFPDDGGELQGDLRTVTRRFAALRLFALYGRWIAPDFQLSRENLEAVARICRLVRGLPLAIILAATWLTVLTPGEIADRIAGDGDGVPSAAASLTGIDFLAADWEGLPARQRSMRMVCAEAWRALSPHEQVMLHALATLSGEFSQGAAHTAAGASLIDLRGLIQKSLIYRTPAGQYALPELLRQYARGLPQWVSPDAVEQLDAPRSFDLPV